MIIGSNTMGHDIIGIWAPLRYTNYGDDLQAIVIAKYIISLGYEVKVFQLHESLAKYYGMNVAHNLPELCENTKLCIIAGGALLTPALIHKRILNESMREYENDFKMMLEASKKFKTKFCAISMGGDGLERSPYWYYSRYRRNFFKSEYFLNGTVRLIDDIRQMEKFGKKFRYWPDFLLGTKSFIQLDSDIAINLSPGQKAIGFNLKKGKYLPKRLLDSIFDYSKHNTDLVFYFIKSHMDSSNVNYEYLPSEETDTIKVVKYTTPTQLLTIMSQIDILITSKLHLALTGLTVGTPYLSFRGPGKARTFTESINGSWAILNDHITFAELKSTYLTESKEKLFNRYDTKLIQEMMDQCNNHFEFCEKTIKGIYNKSRSLS